MPTRPVRPRFTLTVGAALAAVIVACGSTTPNASPKSDAGTDAAEAGACCPPDPAPSCCMHYGGPHGAGGCPDVCDSMPVPTDPSWKLAVDEQGCTGWTNPNDFFVGRGTYSASTSYCGDSPDASGLRDATTE